MSADIRDSQFYAAITHDQIDRLIAVACAARIVVNDAEDILMDGDEYYISGFLVSREKLEGLREVLDS